MTKVIYGVWGDEVIDNRGKPIDEIPEYPMFESIKEFSPGNRILAFVAWNGFLVFDERVDLVDLMRKYIEIIQNEASCGSCVPGRMATKVARDILKKIVEGEGRREFLSILGDMVELTYNASMCDLGHTALIPLSKALKYFREEIEESLRVKKEMDEFPYRWKVTAPCIEACPIQIDIPRYVEFIKKGYYSLSLLTIQEKNPLASVCGRVCIAYCELACRRKNIDEPIAIKHLKRFVSDWVYELEKEDPYKKLSKKSSTGKKVAIIGAGPAGIAAACFLLREGHEVHIYEATDKIGGMMIWGIPEFRLPREVVYRDRRLIEALGAKIFCNKTLGEDIHLKDLKEKYDTIFIGIGAQKSRKLGIKGEDEKPRGYYEGLVFLRLFNSKQPIEVGRKAVVVGAGNVAMDCCRSAKRLGVEEVIVVYRRTENEMPANKEEYEAAKREGVKFMFQTNPIEVITKNGKIIGVKCVKMKLGEPDESGRRRPMPIEGSEFIIEADMLIPAVGQRVDLSWLDKEEGLKIKKTKWDTIVVDEYTLMTDEPGVFAGGDCVLGPSTFIEAEAQGERAAKFMHQYMTKGRFEVDDDIIISKILRDTGLFKEFQFVDFVEPEIDKKILMEETPLLIKKKRDPENIIITPQDAVIDADRCLRCYRVVLVVTEK
ncbi:MAG TPA: hypothetical protein ENG62_00755 [Thermoplasmatales archaeon]|nr:hypothetical protein [Thermoplasmatales archaeon]